LPAGEKIKRENMRRTILAPLLSAFVLPGLGQVINRQFRKAGVLMAAVSILFLTLLLKVLFDLNRAFQTLPAETMEKSQHPFQAVALALSRQDKTVLLSLLFLLILVWAFGVWDAFRSARKSEKGAPENETIFSG
jgi:Na+(H+)/acetate symporter ActP